MADKKLDKVLLKINDDVTTVAETSAKAADDAAAALAVANKAAQDLKEAKQTAIDANEYALQARKDIAAIRASSRNAEQGVSASVEAVEVATAAVKEVKASITVTKTSAVEAQAAAAEAKVAAQDAEKKASAAQIAVEGLKTTIENFNKAGGTASGQQIGATPKDVADAKALADSAKTEAALAKTEATSAVAKAEALKVSITAAKTEATEAKEAAASATAEATAAKTKAEKVLAEFATAKKEATDAAAAARTAAESIETSKTEITTAKTEITAAKELITKSATESAEVKKTAEAAKTTAETAKTAADEAKKAADGATTALEGAKTDATAAKTTAETAKSTAETAKSTADTAKTTADTAKSTADEAKKAADAATTAIETASTTATTAKTTAETAKSTADTAKTEATAAKEDATAAKTTAEAAKTTAEAAKTTAEEAKTSLEAAKTDAAAAKTTAETAKSDAAAAKTAAEEAKKLAEAKTGVEVTAAVEDGVLKINNKSTGVELVTKAAVDEKVKDGVGTALGSPELPTKLLEERNKKKENQALILPKIAVENGIFYIEDALPDDLRAKVLNRHYDDNKNINRDDALKIVQAIQTWYDKLPSNVTISSIGGVFPLVKNKGYRPDFYGEDNRQVTKNKNFPTTVTCHGQQPCIAFMKSKGNKYDFSRSKFILEDMGQDAFHLCENSVDNIIIHGGEIVTRAYMQIGYVGGLQGLFAPIDGWTKEKPHIGTGCADKGTAEAGFNTTTCTFELSMMMNNSYEAQNFQQPEGMNKTKLFELLQKESSVRYTSVGGYWDANGESVFPQEDGTTSKKWGTWRGQQRGSRGYGWRLFGTRNTVVENFDVRGMTGGAIVCGLYGTPKGDSVDARDSKAAFDAGIVAVNTKITGGYFTHNYICGVEAIRASGYEVTGIYAPDSVVGHPDANLEHTRGINGVVSLDPGYQQCTSRYLPMDNIYIHDNVFGLGHRKVMDIHTGNNVRLHNNSGKAMYYGISTVIEEIFAGQLLDPKNPETSKDVADTQSFPYEDSNIEVRGNHITSGMYGLHPINGARGVKARRDAGKWWLRCHQVWMDNVVYAPRGLQCNFGHNHYVIENNQFTFALPYGQFYGLNGVSGLTLTNAGSGYTSAPKVIIEGGGTEAFGAFARAVIEDGKIKELKLQGAGSRFTEAPTVRFEGGGGTGAAATASINTQTYALLVGAEPQYGEILGSVISKNFARNSPEGNYARQFVFGRLTCSSITCNYADITPYTSLTKSKKAKGEPYTSQTMKYRDGLLSAAFYNGAFKMCEVFGNYEHNQLTQVNRAWIGLTQAGSIHTDYAATTYSAHLMDERLTKMNETITALQGEVKALKEAKPAAQVTPAPANPAPATPAPTTQPPAATPANPAPVTPAAPATGGEANTPAKPATGGTETNQPAGNTPSGNTGTPAATNPAPTQPSSGNTETTSPAVTPAPATPTPAQPAPANNAENPANPPANNTESPAATDSGTKSVVFDFANVAADAAEVESNGIKMKTLINVARLGEPLDWAGAFKEVSGKKAMVTAASTGKGTRYIETEGFASVEGKDSYAIIPFKTFKGGTPNAAYSIFPLNDNTPVNAGLIVTNGENGCNMRSLNGTTINGKIPVITDSYDYDKWYIACVKIANGTAFNKLRIGSSPNLNTARIMAVGAGVEFVTGATADEIANKVKALMTTYEIATA